MKRLAAIVFLPLCVADLQAQPRYDVQRLQRLEQVNQENKTARLVVALQDTVLLNATFKGNENELYRIYSITKLFSGLAAGLLWQKGYIKSPEDKLADYFAEWRSQPDKNTITLRHILQHQSGLFTTKGSKDIYGQPDFVAFALYDSLVSTPGHQYQYNNRAINLVSGLVQKTTGQTMRAFLDELLFRPLGIVRYEWPNDAAGNTWGMDGLRLSATDLAKVGMLIANKGQWKGQCIIAQQWFDWAFQLPLTNAMRGVGGYGLGIKTMFYDNRLLLPRRQVAQLEAKGLPTALAQRLYRMADTVYSDFVQFGKALQQRFSLAEAEAITVLASQHLLPLYVQPSNKVMVMHYGEIGQQLVVVPKAQLVVVRYIDEKNGRKTNATGDYRYLFQDEMLPYVAALAESVHID